MSDTSGRQSRHKKRPLTARHTAQRRSSESFEALVEKMSTGMARTAAHEIDNEIERWLREIVLALDIDRSAVWERASPDAGFFSTHWWARPGIPKLPAEMFSQRISPWMTAQALAGRTIIYSSPEELPQEARKLREYLKVYGPTAQVMLPFEIGGVIVGGLTCGRFRGPRDWHPKEVRRLRVVGQIFANALDRKRTDLEVRKIQDEVTLASRRSTMGELAASIAHELSQPLGAILSNANA